MVLEHMTQRKCGDSKADALQKAKELDERMMRRFCVYKHSPKSHQHLKGQEKPKGKVKRRLGHFS